jgi:hypothetical protein
MTRPVWPVVVECTTVLKIVRQYATLFETNLEIQHIALALSLINLHAVYS